MRISRRKSDRPLNTKTRVASDENFAARLPQDEWDAIALSYTSGTTGNPKGV